MSIFDTFTSVLGGSGTTASKFANLALEMITSPNHGGVPGLLDRFRDLGLDDAARSWVSTGKNLPIGRQDIERALGSARIGKLAQKAGIAPELAASELASLLPQLVDKLTPAGTLPEADVLNKSVDLLKSKIGII